MQNFVQPGETLSLLAPYDRLAGQGAKIGAALFGVAKSDVLSGATGEFLTEGVMTLAATSAQTWAVGDRIYWDDTNKRCDNVATVGMLIGTAQATKANPGATGTVKLNEAAPTFAQGQQATIAALVDNSGGGAADGTIGVVTLPDLSAWNGSVDPTATQATAIRTAITALTDAVTELSTKVNAYRTALRAVGILA